MVNVPEVGTTNDVPSAFLHADEDWDLKGAVSVDDVEDGCVRCHPQRLQDLCPAKRRKVSANSLGV